MERTTLKFNVCRAHFEMAGAFLGADVVPAEGQTTREMPNDLCYALLASNYLNAYLAVTTFLTEQITSCFLNHQKSRESFENLDLERALNEKLPGDLSKMLKAASQGLQIARLSKKRPRLMQQLSEFLKKHRNFFAHPNPNHFDLIFGQKIAMHEWGFPQSVAREVITFFFEETKNPVPDWLDGSTTLFRVPKIEVFDVVVDRGGGTTIIDAL